MIKEKLKNIWRNQPSNLGDLHEDKTGNLIHREWRGVSDTAYDYYRWLITWKDIIKMAGKAPVSTVQGLWNYRWMMSYLTAPAWVDRHTEGMRGPQLRITHLHMNGLVKPTTDLIGRLLANDKHFHKNPKLADKIVNVDEIFSSEIMAGFPNLKDNHVTTIPIFLSSMVDQNITPPYLDIMESYGVPADVCPLPSAEAGVAVNDDYPIVGKCSITCNMPCDGSVMNSAFLDRRFNLPTFVLGVPLRYNEELPQEYAVQEVKEMIKFIEEQMGEKFDEQAFFKAMTQYNQQLDYEEQKWEINKTDYPQMTGATFWLYRLFYFHISGGVDDRFIKIDKKVNKLMLDAYKNKQMVSKEMRHRALVWSCPANYYTNLALWLENCWGINVVMDMETMISYIRYDTENLDAALGTFAKTLQRTTMRKHTKGGYANVVDELWRICEEFNIDTVIMYDQISCKGMDGLNGIFDDQARERGINFIWVAQDLMDPRTISRRDMREQVNKYMTTVLQEEPVDPTLVDFDDTLAW
ncbi:MAG: 2-hydroxyacyl-CoA dehydratase family protein [Clostridia bacterium]|nr:2-hydroxyacyl-CoA dehydratase family protein [Clostridia bacterium]